MANENRSAETHIPMFIFRVLIEFDGDYNVFVARCLETGSVTTADDEETVEDMILELLVDEAQYAIEHRNLSNLYNRPSPLEVWNRFNRVAQAHPPRKPVSRAIRARNEEVSTEITFAAAG